MTTETSNIGLQGISLLTHHRIHSEEGGCGWTLWSLKELGFPSWRPSPRLWCGQLALRAVFVKIGEERAMAATGDFTYGSGGINADVSKRGKLHSEGHP